VPHEPRPAVGPGDVQIREEPDRDPRDRLAELLETRRDEIARRWRIEAASVLGGTEDEPAVLTLAPALNDYLGGLARALRLRAPTSVSTAAVWRAIAERHALATAGADFDVGALLEQLLALRNVLLAVARDEKLDGADHRVTEAVIGTVDAAMTGLVASYVQHRDALTRQLRAEYVRFVTHELRNPLTTVMLTASRLRPGDLAHGAERALELVHRNLKRVARLVDTFLLSAEVDADRVHPHAASVLIGEILEATVEPALRAANRLEVQVKLLVDPSIVVWVDPRLTVAALQSVVGASAQFTDEGRVTIEAEDSPRRLILHVHDHCRGLPREAGSNVLEPFRAAHPGKPVPGLGLALARRLVEEQGGSLTVETQQTGGCHFRIALPKP
jgi:signal transduction histidine kinase